MKFLLDENLSPLHARTLRALGHDALSVVDLGLSGADDSVVRHAAIQAGRILVTLDGDFANLVRYPPAETPGVVRFRLHPPTEEAIDAALRSAVSRLAEVSLDGKLVVVDERKIRIRGGSTSHRTDCSPQRHRGAENMPECFLSASAPLR